MTDETLKRHDAEIVVDDEVRLRVVERAGEIMQTPHGHTRGVWVRDRKGFKGRLAEQFDIHGDAGFQAYEVGRRSAEGTLGVNEQAISCCIEGAILVASGEAGLSLAQGKQIIAETVDLTAYEIFREERGDPDEVDGDPDGSAMYLNDRRGKRATMDVIKRTVERLRPSEK